MGRAAPLAGVDVYKRQGTGYTLGEKVFDLAKVEGQIIDNEGMGASKTYVDNVNDSKWTSKDDVIAVSADTGLDLMYHAVRVWYVTDKNNTGVYTYDLAKVETTTCPTAKQIPTTCLLYTSRCV